MSSRKEALSSKKKPEKESSKDPPENDKRKKPSDSENWRSRKGKQKQKEQELDETLATDEEEASEGEEENTDREDKIPPVANNTSSKRRAKVDDSVGELPYREAKAVDRANRSGTGKERPPKSDRQPAFRKIAPIEKDFDINNLIEKLLREKMEMSFKDFVAGNKQVQDALKKQISKQRVPVEAVRQAEVQLATALAAKLQMEAYEEALPLQELDDNEIDNQFVEERATIRIEELPPPEIVQSELNENVAKIPREALIATDPVVQYFQSEGPDAAKPFVAARESVALRVVFPIINNMKPEESIIDPGSMIVAMALSVALHQETVFLA